MAATLPSLSPGLGSWAAASAGPRSDTTEDRAAFKPADVGGLEVNTSSFLSVSGENTRYDWLNLLITYGNN